VLESSLRVFGSLADVLVLTAEMALETALHVDVHRVCRLVFHFANSMQFSHHTTHFILKELKGSSGLLLVRQPADVFVNGTQAAVEILKGTLKSLRLQLSIKSCFYIAEIILNS
jgi:hypothetical protein